LNELNLIENDVGTFSTGGDDADVGFLWDLNEISRKLTFTLERFNVGIVK
jgi:hypothetical protein